MKGITYCSPFVPPEWIAAHGFQPRWAWLRPEGIRARFAAERATCPCAAAMMDEVRSEREAAAVVLTTTCDQMRYASAVLQHKQDAPVLLMHVPSTWQTAASRQLYREELERLGRFLVRLGGQSPGPERLGEVMVAYDRARAALRTARTRLSARRFAQAVNGLRETVPADPEPDAEEVRGDGIPLAVVGGPLLEQHQVILDLIEQAGGRVVLDATEGGERTLPAPLAPERLGTDLLADLAEAYFGTIPDIHRRPNDGFYHWLGRELELRQVRGMILHRYVWCDLWHAEVARLRAWSAVPLVEVDAGDAGQACGRVLGQIEALLEVAK